MKTSFITNCLLLLATVGTVGLMAGCKDSEELLPEVQPEEQPEEQTKLGYWYNDQFIEFQIADPDAFLVQPRFTDNPVSAERMKEILTSIDAGTIISGGYKDRYIVSASERPQHPDLFVSPQYKTSTSDYLYILPEISLCLATEESLNAILEKYGNHLTEKDDSPRYKVHHFKCDFATAEEVLELASEIHQEPTVIWCASNMSARIILDSPSEYEANQELLCQLWQLMGYGSEEDFHMIDEDSRRSPEPNAYRLYLDFKEDGTFQGRDAVNGLAGTYTCNGNQITFNEINTTLIYDNSEESPAFHYGLHNSNSYGIKDGNELRIYYSDDEFLYFKAIQTKLGYWTPDQFIELKHDNSNRYYVKPRFTDTPLSKKQVLEILTAMHVEYVDPTHSDDRFYFFVTAEQRPQHPDLYVSDHYVEAFSTSVYGLYALPQISICMKDGASIDAILENYGNHLTHKERVGRGDDVYYRFNCDFASSDDVLRLAAKIHEEPTVEWCEANKLTTGPSLYE